MKWLRSEAMEYVSLIIHEDAAHDCVTMLGGLGVVEFTDLNPELTPFHRRYVSFVKRCDEMDCKLRFFEGEMTKFKITAKSAGSADSFLADSVDVRYGSQDLDELERILEDKEHELVQLNSMHEKLTREYDERKELQEIISRVGEFFEVEIPDASNSVSFDVDSPIEASETDLAIRFKNITGVVSANERIKFERMVFRATRGNCFTRFSAIDELLVDPGTGVAVEKHAFVIFFQSQFIETKLRKICDAFRASLYTLPSMDDRTAIANLIQNNNAELNQTYYHYDGVPNGTVDVANGHNVYGFGLDPIWKTSENELLFFNSFKMKLSVILGITQMGFGILIKGWNALYFEDYPTFFFDFLPQLVFAASLFFYMVVLIVMKWSIDWTERMSHEVCPFNFEGPVTGCRPPALINTLINIALQPGVVADPMYGGQKKLQQTLLALAGFSVPAMLLCHPLYVKFKHNSSVAGVSHRIKVCDVDNDMDDTANASLERSSDSFDLGEAMIHQSIETIEFVLNMVSNTASYLRLWALSLAHSELSTVFFEKALLSTIHMDSFIAIFVGFALFAGTTFGVILCMDVLECFLHALRLHWVEFQGKFYKADGIAFNPLRLKDLRSPSSNDSL
ncbi:hypothetical protein SDRG_14276 [Saprolegnia diclina VS20]|uniref:V-type proton ATPase subunit a n=1 Tax=Saprolegnia diclina (strain VS20) TaxID=1156394 RepID=T0PRA3_SAPDV|nr:hypothetical protein SDRG_14276 [Saprolegnia diclina VS20]EQC28004.1 hypothetical protein SDRG_14276 [Saprolegnia diclina VS20]|eukprot:XP_008618617.1 hypothetical protein SDRG_14276 [Saprolegnia diclina VS20]